MTAGPKGRATVHGRLPVSPETAHNDALAAVRAWVEESVPPHWVAAGRRGHPAEVRTVRTRAEYEEWYPVYGASGLVVPTWPVEYGGLNLAPALARQLDEELRPFNLGRLNPLGLNLAAPALFAHGTDSQSSAELRAA